MGPSRARGRYLTIERMSPRTRTSIHRALGVGAALSALLAAGCAAGGAASAAALALTLGLSMSAMFGLGCATSHQSTGLDAAVDAGDAGDAEGHWEPCCEDGVVTTCFCPAGVACNYGWYTPCDDGSCVGGVGAICPEDDAGTDAGDDAGGQWEPCCEDGIITTCFCPAETICNYGLYVDCGDGTCTHGEACPAES
jgi:hypothetical protein